jgi:hypothetical protein
MRVLDFSTMSYWRKLFLVVLLVLSLPVQSFAAVEMNCESWQFGSDGTSVHENGVAAQADMGHMHAVLSADSMLDHHHPSDLHHTHSCAACAACCVGAAAPASVSATVAVDLSFAIPFPLSTGGASFLTGGVERPPRPALV